MRFYLKSQKRHFHGRQCFKVSSWLKRMLARCRTEQGGVRKRQYLKVIATSFMAGQIER
jgi:hypothetical protein